MARLTYNLNKDFSYFIPAKLSASHYVSESLHSHKAHYQLCKSLECRQNKHPYLKSFTILSLTRLRATNANNHPWIGKIERLFTAQNEDILPSQGLSPGANRND